MSVAAEVVKTPARCLWCQRPITTPRARRYCSRACFFKARRERHRVLVGAAYRRSKLADYMNVAPSDLPEQLPGWRSHAACRGAPELFYPHKLDARRLATEADALCASCVVRPSCLAWGLREADVTFGRVAGLSTADRKRWRRKYDWHGPEIVSVDAVVNPILAALRLRREQADLRHA